MIKITLKDIVSEQRYANTRLISVCGSFGTRNHRKNNKLVLNLLFFIIIIRVEPIIFWIVASIYCSTLSALCLANSLQATWMKTKIFGKRNGESSRLPVIPTVPDVISSLDTYTTSWLYLSCGTRLSNEKPLKLLRHSEIKYPALKSKKKNVLLMLCCCRHVKRTLLEMFQACTLWIYVYLENTTVLLHFPENTVWH